VQEIPRFQEVQVSGCAQGPHGPARPGLLGANEKGCFRRYGGAASGFDAFVSDRLPAHAASIVSWYARRRTRTRDPLSDHPPPARPKTPPGASPRGLARAPADTANSVGYGSGITERYKRRWSDTGRLPVYPTGGSGRALSLPPPAREPPVRPNSETRSATLTPAASASSRTSMGGCAPGLRGKV
jgi:hypothetical protein